MPIYEYECEECGNVFERFSKSIVIEHNVRCPAPKCKSRKVKRLISQTAFALKGTGWYKTDYQDKTKNVDVGKKDSDKKTR